MKAVVAAVAAATYFANVVLAQVDPIVIKVSSPQSVSIPGC